MIRTSSVSLLVLAFSAMIFTASCEKFRENRQYDTTLDHSVAESTYNELFRILEQEFGNSAGLIQDPCFSITGGDTTFPATYNINLGTDCRDIYEVVHSGSFTLELSADWKSTGAIAVITPNELTIEGYTVTGTLTLTNLGVNTEGQREVAFAVNNGVVTTPSPDSKPIAWECSRVYTLAELNNDVLIHDDVYAITGTAEGVNTEGRTFQVNITDPLIHEQICRWNRAGRVTIKIKDLKDREIYYGADYCFDGAECCDNSIDLKVDGKNERSVLLR